MNIFEITALFALLPGVLLFFISIFVIDSYQREMGKLPPSINFWMFNKELKSKYPRISQFARLLFITAMFLVIPVIINELIH